MAFESVDRFLLEQDEQALWELFHENSKTSRHERHLTYPVHPSDDVVVAAMDALRRVKPYTDVPKIELAARTAAIEGRLTDALHERASARTFGGGPIALDALAAILRAAYGLVRDNAGTAFPRPFRTIPSGGALYPLELYIDAARVDDLPPGLYHYDPEEHALDVLRSADAGPPLELFVQSELAATAAAAIYVSAIFRRSTFKYGDRGYRFALIEAGHLAQNAALAAFGVGVDLVSIGGYFDRDVDRHLRFDGLSESALYVLLVGERSSG